MAARRFAVRRRPRQLEKGEQAGGVTLLRTLGARVYVLGTRRSRGRACSTCGTFVPEHQGTRQTPGVADVLAFLPARGGARVVLWWEAKRPDGGRISGDQQEFRRLCEESNTAHCVGPLDALIAWLIAGGYLRADQVPHYRLPKEPV